MIILPEKTDLDTYLQLPDRASVAVRSSSPHLPSYDQVQAAEAQHRSRPKPPFYRRFHFDARFWRATLIALLIYVALTVAIAVPLIVTKAKRSKPQHDPPWDLSQQQPPQLPSTGNLAFGEASFCNKWDTFDDQPSHSLFTSFTSHTLNASGSVMVRSNVSESPRDAMQISGNFTADINPDPSATSTIFTVAMQASSLDLRQSSHVCFCNEGSERGLAIYVPGQLDTEDTLSFSVGLLFPQTSSPLHCSNFVTSLPMFSQLFGDLHSLSFDTITLEGAAADIACSYMQAPLISVRNSLASISGSFNASQSLALDNISGPIIVNISLLHEQVPGPPTTFSLDTGNGEIRAQVSLLSTSTSGSHEPGGFTGVVKNFNGQLSLNISHDPSGPTAPLDLQVQNNQAPTNLTMGARYFGLFDVQTKLASAHVEEGLHDASRQFIYDQNTSIRKTGWVGSGKKPSHFDPRKQGRLAITSSLSPALLRFGPDSDPS